MVHVTDFVLCCHPACSDAPMELAPVPLCPRHIRSIYEFANALVEDRWSAIVAEAVVGERERVATPVQPPSPSGAVEPGESGEGFVYFIRFSDRIKIGWSANPSSRLKALPHDEVIAIVAGSMDDERKYHARFARLRMQGEWFRDDPAIVRFARGLAVKKIKRR
ncbi:GIY-YIG nuclease family protein [Streptosporangium sp. NPDC004631]